jgi:fructan beta-fructosidase
VELFADDGEVVMTDVFFPDAVFNHLKLYSREGAVQLTSGRVTNLKSIWGGNLAMTDQK